MQNVKGTHDIIGIEADKYAYVEQLLSTVANLFGYKEARIPDMEYTEVFQRGVGDASDIVRKEMYTFLDKAGRSITLRPEFTAGIVRMVVQNKLLFTNDLPYKLYYHGPAFRYERPQLGRYRQFHQFGIENFGDDSPKVIAETIALAYSMLQTLGLENIEVRLNTLGDEESRNDFRTALTNYFSQHINNMCDDCHERLKINPLRILDCKNPNDQEIIASAPNISDYLTEKSAKYFDELLDILDYLEIPFKVDHTLVRGLDYYSSVVFEFHYVSKKGIDYGALGGGGVYGKLLKELGGPELPGLGFSFGIERLVSVLNDDQLLDFIKQTIDFYVAPIGDSTQVPALKIANALRLNGFVTDICFDNVKLSSMIKKATRKNAKYLLIVGEEELEEEKVLIKNLLTQEQEEVEIDNLIEYANELLEGEE